MDTGTHIVMGIALGGIAMVDPVVSNDAYTLNAVAAGVLVGSLIPDIDTVLKLRNNAVYIRHHRGITHSIPAVLMWPILIAFILRLLLPEANFLHLWAWTFLAVFLHVFVDIFNSYGTQALRPFSNKWVAISVINTFDPIIFIFHVIGLLAWVLGADPVITFLTMYGFITLYYFSRFAVKSAVKRAVYNTIPDAKDVFIAPTMRFFQWRVAASSDTCHYVGRAYGRSVTIYDRFDRKTLPSTPQTEAALKDKNVQAFTSFSPIYRWSITDMGELCEVRLIDLRYRSKAYYPFVAVAHVDKELNVVNSYTGWIFSEDKLHKKLNIMPNS